MNRNESTMKGHPVQRANVPSTNLRRYAAVMALVVAVVTSACGGSTVPADWSGTLSVGPSGPAAPTGLLSS